MNYHKTANKTIIQHLAPWKESYDKPRQRIKMQRHHFANKGLYKSKLWFFPIVMYGCESWTIKSCFQTVVLEKTLESPLTARRSNQSILKEINPKYSLEGLMLKLKL